MNIANIINSKNNPMYAPRHPVKTRDTIDNINIANPVIAVL